MSPRSRCSAKLWCLAGTGSMNRIEISFYQPAPTEIGCTVSVLFKVTNDTANQLPAQRLELIGDHYWRSSCSVAVPCIQPYSACPEFTLEMRCVNTTDPAKVPPTFQVRLTKSNLTSTLCWSFWTFTQRLRDYCPIGLPGANGAEKFVILCFGLAGSGKSSFSNSVLTLMHGGKDVVVTVPSGGTTDHNTRTLKRYDVEGADFCLCDTWGLEKSNYKDESKILPALLEGWLPSNWKMEYQLKDRRSVLLANDASRYKRRVHGVLFFVTAGAVHDDQEMETIKASFEKVKRLGYEPVVVLSQADRECTECKANTLGNHAALNDLKAKAATALGIAPKDVIHSVNYTHYTARNFETDRLTYKILDMALHNAHNFCEIEQKLRSMQALISGDWEEEDDLDFDN